MGGAALAWQAAALPHLQSDSWTGFCGSWAGQGAHIPGTGAHTSGNCTGHTLVATRGALDLTGLSVQEAAEGWEMPITCVPTWASLGAWGSTGLEEGLTRDLSLPSPRFWAAAVTELVLSQRSAITHSQKPRQLLSVPG